jgi:hypothetical protein
MINQEIIDLVIKFKKENPVGDRWSGASEGRHNCTAFRIDAFLVKDAAPMEDQAWPILQEWNRKNRPLLPEKELCQALRNAGVHGRQP